MQLKNIPFLKKDPTDILITLNTMAASLIVGELFFKFGSFTLECLSFLATWLVIHNLVNYFIKGNSPS
ncbi:hypothetical protein ACJD0Z_16025 [Flavobacteriaceae bacterium M23B6Z8]